MSKFNFDIWPNGDCSLMNLEYSEHDDIEFKSNEILGLVSLLSDNIGIEDLLKLRDHVENNIKKIYGVENNGIT